MCLSRPAGPVDLRMPSLCHSWLIAMGQTSAARAAGSFQPHQTRNFRNFDTPQTTPISSGNIWQNTRGTAYNHQHNFQHSYATPYTQIEPRDQPAIAPHHAHYHSPQTRFISIPGNFLQHQVWNAQNPTLNRYSNFGAPEIHHNIFNQQVIPQTSTTKPFITM